MINWVIVGGFFSGAGETVNSALQAACAEAGVDDLTGAHVSVYEVSGTDVQIVRGDNGEVAAVLESSNPIACRRRRVGPNNTLEFLTYDGILKVSVKADSEESAAEKIHAILREPLVPMTIDVFEAQE